MSRTPATRTAFFNGLLCGLTLLTLALATPVALAATIARRLRRAPRRSVWTGVPIGILAVNARAECRLGIDAESLVLETYYITDAFDRDLSAARKRWGRLLPFFAFLGAARRYDRFHFFYDRGLLPGFRSRACNPLELTWYRLLGKQTFFWAYGADVRTRAQTETLGARHCCSACPDPGAFCVCDENDAARNLRHVRRNATGYFSMGDMIHYTPGSINDVFYWPLDLEGAGGAVGTATARYAPQIPSLTAGTLRVAHAPNHRHFKGTDDLIRAVESLQADGVPIELDLIEGVANIEALERYRAADVIFDQCAIGFHGYLAQEGMALGKPVLCFIRHPETYLCAADECPIINTPPEALALTLRSLAGDRARLAEVGAAGRRYIEAHHTPAAFADRLSRAYASLGVFS